MAQQTKAQRSAAAKRGAATRQRNAATDSGKDAKAAAKRAANAGGQAAKAAGRAVKAAGRSATTDRLASTPPRPDASCAWSAGAPFDHFVPYYRVIPWEDRRGSFGRPSLSLRRSSYRRTALLPSAERSGS
jgi:hypothetical protein